MPLRPIGGYFELELGARHGFPHDDSVLVGSGRTALEYILRGLQPVSRLYIPYYTCEVVLEPLQRLELNYGLYHIGLDLEIADMPDLHEGEYILVNNYFGIKDLYIERMCQELSGQVIVDNSQAFFTPQYNGQPTFWSPRKFVGVPDGGMASPRYDVAVNEPDFSSDRCSHLLKRIDSGATSGYHDFQDNSAKLDGMPLRRMSVLTETILATVDYEAVVAARRNNYSYLRDALQAQNMLETPQVSEISCPMVYPYRTTDPALRRRLIENNVFVARYWPNIDDWCTTDDLERIFADHIIPLPIDQRYSKDDMQEMLSVIV